MSKIFDQATQDYIEKEAASVIRSEIGDNILKSRIFDAQANASQTSYIDITDSGIKVLKHSPQFEEAARKIIQQSGGSIKAVGLSKLFSGVTLYAKAPGFFARSTAIKLVTA